MSAELFEKWYYFVSSSSLFNVSIVISIDVEKMDWYHIVGIKLVMQYIYIYFHSLQSNKTCTNLLTYRGTAQDVIEKISRYFGRCILA